VRKRVFDIIQIGNKEDTPSRAFDIFIAVVIGLNIFTTFLETFSSLASYKSLFHVIETSTIIIFSIEYVLRLWTADYLYPKKNPVKAKLKFLLSFDGIIDLLTILPFFFLSGFIVFRMLRVVRIFHLFRINAQYDSFNVITNVLYEKKNQIISSVFIVLILLLASSLGIYNAEHTSQPDVFQNAFSGIWWSMSTLLTVGYGDIYPITTVGKIMAMFIELLGVGIVAIPTGIISAGFVEQYTKNEHSDIKINEISEIGEILIDEKSEFIGSTPRILQEEYDIKIYLIVRGELTIIPYDNVVFEKNDIIFVKSNKISKKKNPAN